MPLLPNVLSWLGLRKSRALAPARGSRIEAEDQAAEEGYVPWLFRSGEGTALRLKKVYRRHPWATVQPVSDAPVRASVWSQWWVARRADQAITQIRDRVRGLQERWYQRRSGRPSGRAREEWLGYYQGLYRGHEPQPALFRRLIQRNGVPDWPNPYREGDPGYYDFHPEGLLAADLEAILRGVQQDWGPRRDRSEEVERHRQAARLCWALAVTSADPLNHLVRRLHVANLNMATMDAASSSHLAAAGMTSQDVVDSSVRRGWQPAALAKAWTPLVKMLSD